MLFGNGYFTRGNPCSSGERQSSEQAPAATWHLAFELATRDSLRKRKLKARSADGGNPPRALLRRTSLTRHPDTRTPGHPGESAEMPAQGALRLRGKCASRLFGGGVSSPTRASLRKGATSDCHLGPVCGKGIQAIGCGGAPSSCSDGRYLIRAWCDSGGSVVLPSRDTGPLAKRMPNCPPRRRRLASRRFCRTNGAGTTTLAGPPQCE